MPNVIVTQNSETVSFRTAELELAFSTDDGGLRVLRQHGGQNLVGHGVAQPALDVQVGIDGTWLAERVFVRYLRYRASEQNGALDLEIEIGIGPLLITDRYHVTGTLIARSVDVHNVSDDEIRLRGIRMMVPWARVGELESCRFEAPGNSVRARLPLAMAAAQRRGVLPRRFFAPGLRLGRTLEPAPDAGSGLFALYDPHTSESLLCWYSSHEDTADLHVEGNDTAVTLIHEVDAACKIAGDGRLLIGTQFLLLLHESWPNALWAYRHTASLFNPPAHASAAGWLRDAALYEVHPARAGGFRGMLGQLDELVELGVTALCLLPVWSFPNPSGEPWNENWDAGNPYVLCDFEQLDSTLGTAADLRALCDAAHVRGIRVVVDLPMIGCAPASRHVCEHPEWFCRDDDDAFIELAEEPGVYFFDWAEPTLHGYWHDQAVAQAREYGLDGYRLVSSRHRVANWMRQANQRAHAGPSEVFQLAERICNDLRASNPDAAVIVSLAGPTAAASADLIVHELAHHHMMHAVLNRVAPSELGMWLEDAQAMQVNAVPRAAFVESYHTWLTNPLVDGLRGSLVSRIALAGLVFCGFVPMLRAGQEECDRDYLGSLLAARANHAVLRHGTTRYNSIPCDDPQVFAVLRSLDAVHFIGLLKIGARKRTTIFSLPVDQLGLEDGQYALFDVLRGQWIGEHDHYQWNRDELLSFQLTLEPFEAYGLVIERVGEPVSASAPPPFARALRRQRSQTAAVAVPFEIEDGPAE